MPDSEETALSICSSVTCIWSSPCSSPVLLLKKERWSFTILSGFGTEKTSSYCFLNISLVLCGSLNSFPFESVGESIHLDVCEKKFSISLSIEIGFDFILLIAMLSAVKASF